MFVLYEQITAYIRDGNQVPTSVRGIRLNICDVNWRPPQTMLARKMLTDTVTGTQCERTTSIRIDGIFFAPFDYLYKDKQFDYYKRRFDFLSLYSSNNNRCALVGAMVRAMA